MKTEIQWINPAEKIPPFNKRILVLLGGNGSVDAMKNWEKYVTISDVIITRHSPNDDGDDPTEHLEFVSEPDRLKAWPQYQFDVHNWYQWKFEGHGGEFGDEAEWYSDSICMWAAMPDFSEAIAVGVENANR